MVYAGKRGGLRAVEQPSRFRTRIVHADRPAEAGAPASTSVPASANTDLVPCGAPAPPAKVASATDRGSVSRGRRVSGKRTSAARAAASRAGRAQGVLEQSTWHPRTVPPTALNRVYLQAQVPGKTRRRPRRNGWEPSPPASAPAVSGGQCSRPYSPSEELGSTRGRAVRAGPAPRRKVSRCSNASPIAPEK